jgi:putative methionine-R-sulfoxide reductase with GAF domain
LAERTIAPVLKTGVRREPYRGFESLTLRASATDRSDQEAGADEHRGRRGRVGLDPVRHARFQPLLLTGAFLAVLPTLAISAHPARLWLLAAGVIFALIGVGAWWWGGTRGRPNRQREQIALSLTAVAPPAFLGLVWVIGADRPEAYLPLGAALVCSMAPVAIDRIRVSVQLITGLFFAVMLLRAGRAGHEALLPLLLLASVAVLSTALARQLVQLRSAERSARRDAQRRTELLKAVRELPGASLEEAAAAACATMRSLGFDASGCAVQRGGQLATLRLDGAPEVSPPLRPGEGLAGACIADNRTIVVGDYQDDARRLSARPEVGSAVVVPIRVDGEAVGSLMGARHERGLPAASEVEVAEVLAAHLGGVFSIDLAVRRQRELLTRMGQLETMRSSFVGQVSDELRDPLTVVRGVAATLATHGPELEATRRTQLLEDMGDQTDQLRRTIDALLDFSRFQSTRPEPVIAAISLDDLLPPVMRSTDAELVSGSVPLETTVEVDADLVRHALELLVAGTGVVDAAPQLRLSMEGGRVRIALHADRESSAAPSLVRTLAAQLLVAGGAELAGAPDPSISMPAVALAEVAP